MRQPLDKILMFMAPCTTYCHTFPGTLTGATLTWYGALAEGIIKS
ncbi:hypothetical protein LINPERPRIM_LOCUS38795, partial [Linum perenne]